MKAERLITLIFAIIVVGAILFIAVKFVLEAVTKNNLSSASAQNLQKAYAEEISSQTDVNKLTTDGIKLVKGNELDCGIINLQRAVTLDPNYRDAWVWLGYAQEKNNQPQEAIVSLNKAAKIDPIHPDTFKYLAIAYTQTGDTALAKQAQDKYDLLNKKSD